MADVFLSYARADRARLSPLVAALEQAGFSVWWDRDIQPGLEFEREIESELNVAACVIVAWSKHSVGSSWVYNEASVGLERGNLVPLLLDDAKPPLAFRHLNSADLQRWTGNQSDPEFELIRLSTSRLVAHAPGSERPHSGSRNNSSGSHRLAWLSGILLLTLLVAGGWLLQRQQQTHAAPSIVILDFDEADEDDSRFLALGVSEQVRNLLTRSSRVLVAARTLSSASREELRGLNIEYLLEGVVGVHGSDIVVDVHLVDVKSGLRAWSQQLRKSREALLDLSFDVTQGVLQAMGVTADQLPPSLADLKPTSNPAAYERYLEGIQLLQESKSEEALDKAAAAFQAALQNDSGFARAYAKLCQINVRRYRIDYSVGRFDDAFSQCHRALELDSYLPEAFTALGDLHLAAGQKDEALEAFTRAINLSPDDPDIALGLASSLTLGGEVTRAEQWFQRAQTMAPGYWRIYESLGSFNFRRGHYAQAVADYEKAVELNPADAVSWAGLGAAKTLTADFSGALLAATQSMELQRSAQAISNTASAYYFVGSFDQAAELYRQALALEPDNHLLWGNLGEALAQSGTNKETADAFEHAAQLARDNLAINSQDPETLSRLATYLAFLGDPGNESEALLQSAGLGAGNDPYFEYDAALTYLRLDRVDAARARLDRARALGYPEQLIAADPQLAQIR